MRLVNKEKGLEGRINRLRACILKTAEELSKTRKQKNRLIDEIHVERQVEVIVGRLDSLAVGLDE